MTASEDPDVRARRSARSVAAWAAVVGLVSGTWFVVDLAAEPPFVDESAYYSQSYFARLYAEGRWDDPAWLTYPALDLPPLPKYLIGGALAAAGIKTPGPREAFAWYDNTSLRFDPPGALTVARLPSVPLGVIGCLAVFLLGLVASGRTVGVVAAGLLALNPLYRMLARRAMSDVPCEAMVLVALALTLWAWSRFVSGRSGTSTWLASVAAGGALGLALSCKMSGTLAVFVVGAWLILAAWTAPRKRCLFAMVGAVVLAGIVASATVVALNPFLTARPVRTDPRVIPQAATASTWERARMMMALRLEVARGQQVGFPHNALTTPGLKVGTAVAQGFGRFGPLGPAHSDSTKRFDFAQDWGALVWFPLTLLGALGALARGSSQRQAGVPATAWALLAQWGVTVAVVTAYLPLAWDRYFLALQAPGSLLAADALVGLARRAFPGRSRTDPKG